MCMCVRLCECVCACVCVCVSGNWKNKYCKDYPLDYRTWRVSVFLGAVAAQITCRTAGQGRRGVAAHIYCQLLQVLPVVVMATHGQLVLWRGGGRQRAGASVEYLENCRA